MNTQIRSQTEEIESISPVMTDKRLALLIIADLCARVQEVDKPISGAPIIEYRRHTLRLLYLTLYSHASSLLFLRD